MQNVWISAYLNFKCVKQTRFHLERDGSINREVIQVDRERWLVYFFDSISKLDDKEMCENDGDSMSSFAVAVYMRY